MLTTKYEQRKQVYKKTKFGLKRNKILLKLGKVWNSLIHFEN